MTTSQRCRAAAARPSERSEPLSHPAMRLCHLELEAERAAATARGLLRRWISAPHRTRLATHARRDALASPSGCRTPCSHPVRTWPSDFLQVSAESSSSLTPVMLLPVEAAAGSSFVAAHLL